MFFNQCSMTAMNSPGTTVLMHVYKDWYTNFDFGKPQLKREFKKQTVSVKGLYSPFKGNRQRHAYCCSSKTQVSRSITVFDISGTKWIMCQKLCRFHLREDPFKVGKKKYMCFCMLVTSVFIICSLPAERPWQFLLQIRNLR